MKNLKTNRSRVVTSLVLVAGVFAVACSSAPTATEGTGTSESAIAIGKLPIDFCIPPTLPSVTGREWWCPTHPDPTSSLSQDGTCCAGHVTGYLARFASSECLPITFGVTVRSPQDLPTLTVSPQRSDTVVGGMGKWAFTAENAARPPFPPAAPGTVDCYYEFPHDGRQLDPKALLCATAVGYLFDPDAVGPNGCVDCTGVTCGHITGSPSCETCIGAAPPPPEPIH
jgi:hypothetical protein